MSETTEVSRAADEEEEEEGSRVTDSLEECAILQTSNVMICLYLLSDFPSTESKP